MREVAGGVKAEILPGKAGLCFWCCFSVTVSGRVEGKLREEMDYGEGNLFGFGGEESGFVEVGLQRWKVQRVVALVKKKMGRLWREMGLLCCSLKMSD
jgi:hypothetical protein